jgi:hypothetical protein
MVLLVLVACLGYHFHVYRRGSVAAGKDIGVYRTGFDAHVGVSRLEERRILYRQCFMLFIPNMEFFFVVLKL